MTRMYEKPEIGRASTVAQDTPISFLATRDAATTQYEDARAQIGKLLGFAVRFSPRAAHITIWRAQVLRKTLCTASTFTMTGLRRQAKPAGASRVEPLVGAQPRKPAPMDVTCDHASTQVDGSGARAR